MKSLRLTKQLRESILNSFIEKYVAANPAPPTPLKDRELGYLLSDPIHKLLYGKYVGKFPNDLISTSHYVVVKMPNDSVKHIPYPADEKGSNNRLSTNEDKVEYVLTNDDPIFIKYQYALDQNKEMNLAVKEYDSKFNKFVSDITQVLESVNTTKQLVEVWPESEPFLPVEVSNPSSINLPAVNFAEINKLIK